MNKLLLFPVILLLSVSSITQAIVERFEFDDEQHRLRYQQFIDELRCPKCQNQNLAGSDSQIAQDLRRRLYEMIEQGKSDQEILDHMVERYGNFVLYDPPVDKNTIWLWLLPSILLFISAIVVLSFVLYRKPVKSVDSSLPGLSEAEQKSLDELLNRHKND